MNKVMNNYKALPAVLGNKGIYFKTKRGKMPNFKENKNNIGEQGT